MNRRRSRFSSSHRERGSAFVIALLALVVLSTLGMSLAATTTTEMKLGASERSSQRLFAAADSGIAASTARAMVAADYASHLYELHDDNNSNSNLGSRYDVDVSPFYPILDAPCNLCEINNSGTYSEKAFRKINHAVTSTAQRVGQSSGSILGEKTVTRMLDVQPWKVTTEAYAPMSDPGELARIRF